LQTYSASVSAPDSTFSFQLLGVSTSLGGTLGIDGVTSASLDGSPSAVPEPGTIALLAGGLLGVVLVGRRARAHAGRTA
jgi:hypothetical protein